MHYLTLICDYFQDSLEFNIFSFPRFIAVLLEKTRLINFVAKLSSNIVQYLPKF
jgi:hypothetical protein